MCKFLEYADLLKEWDTDQQIYTIYQQMTGILKNQLSDVALLRLEKEVTNDCKAMGLEDDGSGRYPYAWLIAPLHDAAVLQDYSNNAWIGGMANLFRLGYRSDLEQRQQWHFHSVCAAAMLCVAYAESLQSGRVARDDMLTMAAIMKDLAFVLSDAAFFGSSSTAIAEQMRKYKRAKSAKSGAKKGFKAKFKNTVFLPALKERLAAGGLKHGWQAEFIREMENEYDLKARRAQKRGWCLSDRDEFITEKTLAEWIRKDKAAKEAG